jgi:hypothetical protein
VFNRIAHSKSVPSTSRMWRFMSRNPGNLHNDVFRVTRHHQRFFKFATPLLAFAVFNALFINIWMVRVLHKTSFNPDETLNTSWSDVRTKLFSKLWQHHKIRNVAVFVCLGTRYIPFLDSITYHLLQCPDVYYHPRFDELFQMPRWCLSHGCLSRFGKSQYLYASFVVSTYEQITSLRVQPEKPFPGCKIAVLVEPRMHPLYEYTIKQVMSTLGSGWSLQLFVSSENEQHAREVLEIEEGKSGQHIVVTPLSTFGLDNMGHLGNRVQSAFSAHEAMYLEIEGEYILWFQLDVIMRHSPPPQFFQEAYIGSEWQSCEQPCMPNRCKRICGGGNSGLSMRRRSKLLPIATKGSLPEDLWGIPHVDESHRRTDHFEDDEFRNNSVSRWFEDDLQLSFKLSRLGSLPFGDVQFQFAIGEAMPKVDVGEADPCGLHKPWLTPTIPPAIIEQLFQVAFTRATRTVPEQQFLVKG